MWIEELSLIGLAMFTKNMVIQFVKFYLTVDLFTLGLIRSSPSRVFTLEFIFHWLSLSHHICVFYLFSVVFDIDNCCINQRQFIINLTSR